MTDFFGRLLTTDTATGPAPGVQALQAVGLSSTESFGQAVLGPLRATGLTSTEVFGAANISATLQATGLASTAAFGGVRLTQAIRATGLPSTTTFGAAATGAVLRATGLPSTSAFGQAIMVGPLQATGLASTAVFGSATIARFVDLTISPAAAVIGRPRPIQLFGSLLNMRACEPDLSFVDPAFWTAVTAGTVRDNHVLEDKAALRTIVAETHIDVEAQFRVMSGATPALVLFASSDTVVTLTSTELTLRVNGRTTLTRPLATTAATANPTLRILRRGAELHVFTGTRRIVVDWVDAAARVQVQSTGGTSRLIRYVRRPIIEFGTSPMLNIVRRATTHIVGTAPDARTHNGPVDITVHGCNGTVDVLSDAFTYRPATDVLRLRPDLLLVGDPTVRD